MARRSRPPVRLSRRFGNTAAPSRALSLEALAAKILEMMEKSQDAKDRLKTYDVPERAVHEGEIDAYAHVLRLMGVKPPSWY